MLVFLVVCLVPLALCQEAVLYDAYFGKPVTEKRGNFLANVVNGTSLCTVPVRPCRKDEGRRVDGTCTNPKYPSRGATMTPLPRLLPPRFGQGNSLRPARDGSELPSTRLIRTTLLSDGIIQSHDFSSLAAHVFVFSFVDNVDLVYLFRYVVASDCCIDSQIPNYADPRCIPILVPRDDPFLRRTNIRCLNLTRVETFQDFGCLPNSLPAERYSRVTPLLDLSVTYGNTEDRSRAVRANEGGLLAFMMEGDREVPAGTGVICLGNRVQDGETSCYNYGDNLQGNLLLGIYITAMWFFREHNRIARKLSAMNPCWGDDKLFETARQINIAQWQYIYYYELIPEFIGYHNALSDGIIYDTEGHVNDFDPDYEPGVYREYVIGCRWFHTMQSGYVDLYRNGKYAGSRTIVDDSLRPGILALNNTEADITQGCTIQPADKFDYVFDPDISNRIHDNLQTAADEIAIDMMRGRDAGLPSYNEYRKFCGMRVAKTFEDFHDTIDKDRVEKLKRLYDDVDDVEFMVAVYIERLLPGAYVGPTLYCVMAHNLRLWRKSDKFFFEHGGFPAAFNIHQLAEIRKTSMARLMCDNGDNVKEIQKRAFLRKGAWNDYVPCEEIRSVDLSKWKDPWCPAEKNEKDKKKEDNQEDDQQKKLYLLNRFHQVVLENPN